MAPRQPFRGDDYFPRRRNRSIGKKTSKSRPEELFEVGNTADVSSSSSSRNMQIAALGEQRSSPDRNKTRNVSFASETRRQSSTAAPIDGEEIIASDNKRTTGRASSVSSAGIHRGIPKDETFPRDRGERRKLQDSDRSKIDKSLSVSSDEIHSDESRNDDSRKIFNESGGLRTSGTVKKRKSMKRHSSDRIRSYKPEMESAHKISRERKKLVAYERSRADTTKSDAPPRIRRISRGDQDGRFGVQKMAHSSDKSNLEEIPRIVVKHENNRIVLPSRMSTRCQGIRHAFGLSSAYCDCDQTGSGVRRARLKKISRGVQCDPPKKSRCGLGEYFGFKCCKKKSRRSRKRNSRNSRNSTAKGNSTESSEVYEPKRKEPTKESQAIAKNYFDQSYTKREVKNKRMGGGAEEINFSGFENAGDFPRCRMDQFCGEQRHRRGQRRKSEASTDRANKNGVDDVKRRLNDCLIELNGIIGDVGFIF